MCPILQNRTLKCAPQTFTGPSGKRKLHDGNASQRRNNTANKTSSKIPERAGHMMLTQALHRLKHNPRHRRQTTKKTQANTTTNRLADPTTQTMTQSPYIRSTSQKKTRKHIRNERANNKRRAVHRRQQHIQTSTAADADETADKDDQIHQTIRQRIEPRLNALHRSKWNLRRIRRSGRARRTNIGTRHFRQVKRLRSGIWIVACVQ